MNDLMICKYDKCQKYLVDPIVLPCSFNICKTHVDELMEHADEHFKCFVCNSYHETPSNGFILNTFAARIIDLNLHLNDNQIKVSSILTKIKYEVDEFDAILRDPECFIFENIASIRNKIDLERERLINEINNISDGMLNQLQKYESNCKENIKQLRNLNEQYEANLRRISADMSSMKEELRLPSIDKIRNNELMLYSNQLFDTVKEKCLDYKRSLLMEKECIFEESNTRFEQNLFGRLAFKDSSKINVLNTSQILTQFQFNDLIKLCEFEANVKFDLIYRASKDGFSAKNFHDKCDEKANLLTLIKVKDNSNVFGAFSSVSISPQTSYKTDTKAFIVSLINKDMTPMKINVAIPSSAVCHNSNFCSIFGEGHDIFISNNSNENKESFTNLGVSYKSNKFASGKGLCNFLSGSYFFMTEEIEVFQVS